MDRESPCLTCVIVERPGECGNKNCGDWRKWFMQRWNEMRTAPLQKLKALDQNISTDDYIVVGGHKYYHPDTVRKRMENGGNDDE